MGNWGVMDADEKRERTAQAGERGVCLASFHDDSFEQRRDLGTPHDN